MYIYTYIYIDGSQFCAYTPDFPSSSPYVTSVGATQGLESNSAEIVCQSDLGIFSLFMAYICIYPFL
jgi:subtilase family serine protease